MSRIIINNQTKLSDSVALEMISQVVKLGRISNNGKQYCYLCVVPWDEVDYHVVSALNKNSDSFTIYKPSKK